MKEEITMDIMQKMLTYLNNEQLYELRKTLDDTLSHYEIVCKKQSTENNNDSLLNTFISAKRIEGCSEKTLKYYQTTIESMITSLGKDVRHILTEDLRHYLINYQNTKNSSRITIDNIRRILSSFYSWLEDEDYIVKSPVRRIHKIKTSISVKETYTDFEMERMRDSCLELRDLAIIDMLASTGMRIGEMVLLNKADIDFNERECVVLGKGNKVNTALL